MTAYADTSFVASLYVDDVHSRVATEAMDKAVEPFVITPFVEVEVVNAIQLRVFRKHATAQQAQAAVRAFGNDLQAGVFSTQPVPSAAFDHAKRLALRFTATLGVRSLDLLQVASAIAVGADTFASFDNTQRKLAHAAGLSLHPKVLSHLKLVPPHG